MIMLIIISVDNLRVLRLKIFVALLDDFNEQF
jgi:hypothetical protein